VVELVIAWWERAMVVVVVSQGEILGSPKYVFGKKIEGNKKMGQEERIDAIFCYFVIFFKSDVALGEPWDYRGLPNIFTQI
jgi:hypothetical protein